MEQIKLLLSKAHAEFRRLRSGELGDNLRSQGINYKVIWGVESYRLKEIARTFQTEISSTKEAVELATALWNEDVRESKMLATRLFPIEAMTQDLANEWSDQVQYTELADQLCMNLISRLDCAEALATQWIGQSEIKQYMSLQTALRLDIEKLKPQAEAIATDASRPMWLRATAQRLAL